VKGLDYSLLNKVRSEMDATEEAEELEQVYEEKKVQQQTEATSANNRMVKNLTRVMFPPELPKRNDMFARGRMAYVVEIDDEEADVPSTLMRSTFDCPMDQTAEGASADEVIVSKLTQVLGYLRSDTKKKKRGPEPSSSSQSAEHAAASVPPNTGPVMKIFDDVDDYAPSRTTAKGHRDSVKYTSKSDREKVKGSLFDDIPGSRDKDEDRSRRDRDERRRDDRDRDSRRRDDRDADDRRRDDREERRRDDIPSSSSKRTTDEEVVIAKPEEEPTKSKRRRLDEEDAYSELYPMGIGMMYAGGGESDEETDFSKMDAGNKKGSVKRWDFETDKDYERYQDSREALPKAAFQYGVKTQGGRKTRKAGAAGEKKLDRELDKINKILDDRKKGAGEKSNVRY